MDIEDILRNIDYKHNKDCDCDICFHQRKIINKLIKIRKEEIKSEIECLEAEEHYLENEKQ